MRALKKLFWFLWKTWFYLWALLVIIIISPFLIITILSEKTYSYFFVLARFWAKAVFYGVGFSCHISWEQKPEKGKSYMLIANHTSMMDIMLMLISIKDNPFVFIGKKELAKLPIFGFFYKRTCILVDRGDSKSKAGVIKMAEDKLEQGYSICIFPEGGVPDDTSIILDDFKDGAFRLAIEYQIPIIPLSFGMLKKYFPFEFFAGRPGKVPVVVHSFIETEGKTQKDKRELKEQARNVILKQLEEYE